MSIKQSEQAQSRPKTEQPTAAIRMSPAVEWQGEQQNASPLLTNGTSLHGLPNVPTTQRLRQQGVVQLQRRLGNGHVQRMLRDTAVAPEVEPDNELSNGRSGGAAIFSPPTPPPSDAGSPYSPIRNRIQREEGSTEESGPSEAEKAAAKAAAQAAEAAANAAANEGQQEIVKSQEDKQKEQTAGQAAQQEATQVKAATPPVKKKEEKRAGGREKKAGAVGGAAVNGQVVPGQAPTSPEADLDFQKMKAKAQAVGKKEKSHAPAETESQKAQEAAEMPAAELEGRAGGAQVDNMEQAETPAFNAAAFKAQLMQRIEAMSPKTASEADNFKKSGKMNSVKGDMTNKVKQEQESSKTPMDQASKAAPDAGSVPPKPVTPLAALERGEQPGDIGAAVATPKQKGHAEVEAPLKEKSRAIDQEMAEADVTEEQLANSNEPEFQAALTSKDQAQTHAEEGPQLYREQESQEIAQAQGEAGATAAQGLGDMHTGRDALLAQVEGQQTATKSKDEQAREEVGQKIQTIYDQTKEKVEQKLSKLDSEVDRLFDAGAAAAKKAFEDFVDAKMKAYKERRYGGWLGWAKWGKDKLLGMPAEVNGFYQQGRQLYIRKMDAVIDTVVSVIGRTLTEAKAEIAKGKQKITDYVNSLPDDLREVGQQAAQDIQAKFDDLEQTVDSKQDALIDNLANKYKESLGAIDARIEELKAANKGLVDKAIGAVKGVVDTILKLKEMLLSVLAQAADAIGKIIKDPIGFLRNLISGVKQGLSSFVANIATHLKKGLMGWLFGELAQAGIQLPEKFDLQGILTLVMQVLGLTWANLRAKAVKMFGEPVVAGLEKGFEIFMIVKEKGIGGLWEFVKDKLSSLKDTVIEGIKDMVITQVIQAGVQWLIGILGGPAGAFVKAAKAIYDIVMWFVSNGSRLVSLVQAILSSISAIAGGAVGAAAKFIEEALAKTLPIVISFLASLLGLGNLAQKIKTIIQKVQAPINKAIEWVLGMARAAVKKISSMLGSDKDKGVGGGDPQANAKAKKIARARVTKVTQRPFNNEKELKSAIKQIEIELIPVGLQSLQVTPKAGKFGRYDIVARNTEDVGDAQVNEVDEVERKLAEMKSALVLPKSKQYFDNVVSQNQNNRKKALEQLETEDSRSDLYPGLRSIRSQNKLGPNIEHSPTVAILSGQVPELGSVSYSGISGSFDSSPSSKLRLNAVSPTHAEGRCVSKLANARDTKAAEGGNATISVDKPPCGFCKGAITSMKNQYKVDLSVQGP